MASILNVNDSAPIDKSCTVYAKFGFAQANMAFSKELFLGRKNGIFISFHYCFKQFGDLLQITSLQRAVVVDEVQVSHGYWNRNKPAVKQNMTGASAAG